MDEAVWLRAIRRTQKIMWFAFLAEPSAYVGLSLVWGATQNGRVVQRIAPWPAWVWYLPAVLLAAASVFVRRLLLSARFVESRLESGKLGSHVLPVLGRLTPRSEWLSRLSRVYLTHMIIAWSLNGFVPIGGLMLLFTKGDGVSVLALSLAALVLNALAYPRFDRFVERMGGLCQSGEDI